MATMMKRNNYLQHLTLENAYVKFRSNELLHNNEKLQNEISELKLKLDHLYKCHANSILMLQEKNHHLTQMIQEKDSRINLMMDYSPGRHVNKPRFSSTTFSGSQENESELTFE